MASSEKKQAIIERLKGVLYFFLSIFLSLLGIGTCFRIYQIPSSETYLSPGFQGVIGALVALGGLKLAEAFMVDADSRLQRASRASLFLVCLCAASGAIGLYDALLLGVSGSLTLLGRTDYSKIH